MMRQLLIATMVVGIGGLASGDEGTPAARPAAPAAAKPLVEEPPTPPIGYRFAKLSVSQRKALRPRFRLPLDRLASASSPSELRAAAVVDPVPDPSRPLLPVKREDATTDPFNESQADVNKFDVLNKLFAAELAAAEEESATGDFGAGVDGLGGGDLGGGFVEDEAFAPIDDATPADDANDGATEDAAAEQFDDPFADF